MKIQVTIEEHIAETFEVEADSLEKAMEIASQKYDEGEFVVDTCQVPNIKLMMADNGQFQSEWREF